MAAPTKYLMKNKRLFQVVYVYSETTWAVGIAQLLTTRFKVGGKNPETEVVS